MPTIEEALFNYLSTETSYPVYPQNFPQKFVETPCITYTKTQGGREYDLLRKIGFEHPTFQLDVFAEDYAESVDVSAEIKELLNGFRGSWSSGLIYNVIVKNVADGPAERNPASDQFLFHQVITLEIWYARA